MDIAEKTKRLETMNGLLVDSIKKLEELEQYFSSHVEPFGKDFHDMQESDEAKLLIINSNTLEALIRRFNF